MVVMLVLSNMTQDLTVRFKAEEAQANKPERLLNEDGTYPAPVSKKAEKK